ncbi:pectinesterase inhibitor-like [Salvia splendens]|uniref:pectinesterase inhibitor-like n=1 Tax=Salvia splendens TaxID=180675 RepID=UPI001C26D987|nr:pectinesterase inhibitor-like [Salvia splendens]
MSYSTIIFLSLALLSQCHADLIGDLCTKSNNPSLCNQALRSDPRSKGADARGLAGIALDNSLSTTQASINVAKSVSNPGNKEIIDTCVENFGEAVDNLQEAKPLIQKLDRPSISTLQTRGSAALTDVDTCSDEFGASEPSELKQATDKAYTFIQLLLIIINTL